MITMSQSFLFYDKMNKNIEFGVSELCAFSMWHLMHREDHPVSVSMVGRVGFKEFCRNCTNKDA